jgi:hypothetical protein
VLVVADPAARRLLRKRRTVRATLSVELQHGDEVGFVHDQTTFGFRRAAGSR